LITTLIILGTISVSVAADGNTISKDDGNSTVLLPDLIISSLNYPETPSPGESQTIGINVKNQGTASSEKTELVLYIDGSPVREWNLHKLAEGESAYNSYTWIPLSEGSVEIKAVVDEANSISESDETNNEKTATVTVAENFLPDLIIEDIVPEAEGEVGKPLNLTLKVKNQGTAASGEAEAEYYINGTAPSQNGIEIPALSAGEEKDITFSLIPDREGEMEVKVVIDSGTSVYEGDAGESNNQFTEIVKVKTTLPDLLIGSYSLSPEAPRIGDSITFTVTVKNKGLGDSGTSELKYYINGTNTTYSNTVSIPEIVAGETTETTFSWVPEEEGDLKIKLIADANNAVSEDDETNNQLTKTFSVSKQITSTNEESSDSSSSSSSSSSGSSSSSSKSSGGMGSSASKEPVKNVEVKELATRNIMSGYHVRYDFVENATCITYIEFDPTITYKKVTAIVEVLKNKSTFVKNSPPGRIYKQVNIWVGNKVMGLPDAHENAYTGFKVDKGWINNNSVNESNITLLWYDDSTWEPLITEKTGEDKNYVYFTAETSGYSCFAISEYTGEDGTVEESSDEGGVQKTLRGSGGEVLNSSAEREEDIEKIPMGIAKTVLALSLPLFIIFVGYFVLKKKI
jgi:PGF-pre-PGF domain-containing protein